MNLILLVGIIYYFSFCESREINSSAVFSGTESKLQKFKYPRKQKECIKITKAKLGKPAPDWKGTAVINGSFQDISSSDYRGKYLIFLFYPLDFTFVCPTEIRAFNDRIDEFRKINTEVVAVSVDSQFAHLAWIHTPQCEGGLGNVSFPLLSDLSHEISKAYGVYSPDVNHAYRGLFLIDPKGVIRHVTMNDMHVGRNVDETLRLVQAYQHTDTHGEVCPAGWKPGEKTIIIQPCSSSSKLQTTDDVETDQKIKTSIKPNSVPIQELECKKCEEITKH